MNSRSTHRRKISVSQRAAPSKDAMSRKPINGPLSLDSFWAAIDAPLPKLAD